MFKFLGKRLIQMFITLLLFQVITFLLLDLQPGDIADLLTFAPDIPPAEVTRLRQELGLDRPLVERMFTYILNFYRGDLGVSFQEYPTPVIDIIKERLPRTIVLFVTANIIAFWLGVVTGRIQAWRRGGLVEYGLTIVGVLLYTIFLPWFALMMIWLFAVRLDWFPPGKFIDPIKWLEPGLPTSNEVFLWLLCTTLLVLLVMFLGYSLSNRAPRKQRLPIRIASLVLPIVGLIIFWLASGWGYLAWDLFSHLVLPVLTLTLWIYAGTMLLMRTSMLDTLGEDYILTARAKGIAGNVVRDRHAARNALLPVWTSLVFGIVASIGGGIIIEKAFSWPGIGLAFLNASLSEDIPLAMGILTILGVMALLGHLIVDLGYVFLDPRIRYS